MSDRMKAAVMDKVGRITLQEREIPEIGDSDALVRVNYVGVCGSDMALFENGYIGQSVVTQPMVLGHEAAGTVVRIGRGVTHLKPGDRVAMEPGIPCMKCEFCRVGKYNLCPRVYFWASLPVTEGAFQEYVRHPADFCFPLPDNVTTMEGALIEPLSVGYHAVTQSGICVGQTGVILGAGCIGLVTLLTLKAAGASEVTVVDLVDNRLAVAKHLGAHVLDARKDDVVAELASRYGDGPDCVFETAGNPVTMDQAIQITKRGGTITLVGYAKNGRADLNVNLLIDKELTIKTVFRYRNIYPKAIAAVANGSIPLKEIASDVFSFDEVQKGMEYAIHNKGEVTKCVIRITSEDE